MGAMRTIAFVLTLAFIAIPLAAATEPGPGEPCAPRDPKGVSPNCVGVQAGNMECMNPSGTAALLSSVVGGADSGTFKLFANGTNHLDSASVCTFEIAVDASAIRFNEGWTVGLLAPYGGVTNTTSQPCTTTPGQTCTTTASFTWWRAQHGVTFDIPFDLIVNGIVVARGKCHYFDPPVGPTLSL